MKRFLITALFLIAGCATTSSTPVDTPPSKTKMAEGYYMKGLSHLQQKN